MTDIADRVRQIIVDHFKARDIDSARVVPDARLIEDLGADSLDLTWSRSSLPSRTSSGWRSAKPMQRKLGQLATSLP